MEANNILGKVIIGKEEWEKDYPMELEYYLTKETEDNKEEYFGIGIKKTYTDNKEVTIEQKEINRILKNENRTKELLNLLLENKVTPIGLKETVIDIFKTYNEPLNYRFM